ncbi:unnamed protein product [[Candida] boidinii]|nr:unnamed protein product [[Candida] boidinii]
MKKDAKKVKDALPKLSSDEVKDYLETGKVQVADIDLVKGDLTVLRGLPESKVNDGQEVRSEGDVLIILDIKVYPELKTEGVAREIVNRIQKLRKKCNLQQTDDVIVQYDIKKDTIGLQDAINDHSDMLEKTCRRPLELRSDVSNEVISDEEFSINDSIISLRLLKL